MKGTDLVIFDCDGVLVDSERVSIGVVQRVLADLGWTLTLDEIVERFVGGSKEHFDAQVEHQLGRRLPPGWDEPYASWYLAAFERELEAVPGIAGALDRLGLPWCVASNSTHEHVRRSLGLVGLLDRFDGRIFSAEDVQRGKPAPDVYLLAARTMGVPAERCIVIEDSRFGVRAARAAGMRVLGYAGGLTPADWLEREGATVFTSMEELSALVAAT